MFRDLLYRDFNGTCAFYHNLVHDIPHAGVGKWDRDALAFLGCNDRFYLLSVLCHRSDIIHPWLFLRCREVEAAPDGHIDLWARWHYKSTIITFGGLIQELLIDPEVTCAIFSVTKAIAQGFLSQIKEELENNDDLKWVYRDVLYQNPKTHGPDGRPAKWSLARGITVKRRGNPKEATIEAHGLIDGQPTSRHFDVHDYDDIVTQDHIGEDQIKKTTLRWEMADNLGSHKGTRKRVAGTFYHFADTHHEIIDRKSLIPRIYPATDDGTLNGKPVFMSPKEWTRIKRDQRSVVSAQMLLNPAAGAEATFQTTYLRSYDVFPSLLNVYIMVDPSKGSSQRSDRTAIAVVGIDVNDNKYLIDGYCHRMKLSERYARVMELHAKWSGYAGCRGIKIGWEQYGMQVDLEVVEDMMIREGRQVRIEELNTPRQGGHSKDDRIGRLEPDLRGGRFYLPITIHNPDFGGTGQFSGMAYWQVWTEEKEKAWAQIHAEDGMACPYNVGQIMYSPVRGLTRMQRYCESVLERSRIVAPIKRRDESGDVYDVTRRFISEMSRHPFAPHDDFIDACSRIYDMDPNAPLNIERGSTEPIEGVDDPRQMLDA